MNAAPHMSRRGADSGISRRIAKRVVLETEPGIRVPVACGRASSSRWPMPDRMVLVVRGPNAKELYTPFVHQTHKTADATYVLSRAAWTRARWTTKNPPNFVERSFALIGRTADTCRVWDIIARRPLLARRLRRQAARLCAWRGVGRRARRLRGRAGTGNRRRNRPPAAGRRTWTAAPGAVERIAGVRRARRARHGHPARCTLPTPNTKAFAKTRAIYAAAEAAAQLTSGDAPGK